jgi:hypothetical protein
LDYLPDFWKLRSYLISKIENHVFEPFLEGHALRYSWHSRSDDAVIRDYDEPGNVIETHKRFAVLSIRKLDAAPAWLCL